MLTCGEFGGITESGDPCKMTAGHGTGRDGYGRCMQHKNSYGLPKLEEPKKNSFLNALIITYGNISRAVAAARIDRGTHYYWLEHDEEYVVAYKMAQEIASDEMEMEACRRATSGSLKPIYQQGFLVGHERISSDTLLMAQLKARKPEKYKDRQEVSGPDGGPIQVDVDDLRSRLASRIAGVASRIGAAVDHPGDDASRAGGA